MILLKPCVALLLSLAIWCRTVVKTVHSFDLSTISGRWKRTIPRVSVVHVHAGVKTSELEAEDIRLEDLPAPADPTGTANPEDDFTRSFRKNVPKSIQHFMRDSGILRFIVDSSAFLVVPSILEEYPSALADFLRLTGNKELVPFLPKSFQSETSLEQDISVEKVSYGADRRQFASLLQPQQKRNNRLVVFVHGGAWGSGFPSMYQLVATPFLNQGFHVAIVGYRTFPTANCTGQMDDLAAALQAIQQQVPHIDDVSLIGHSSGSHISALALATGRLEASRVQRFVSLAGVFDIPDHYRFETGRGVERISPMAAACGYQLQRWKDNSPRYLIEIGSSSWPLPLRSFFLHGALDTTVPYTSSQHFATTLGTECKILRTTGHADMVLHLMFGGETLDVVLNCVVSED
jgi:acetyl esterase/lipase